MARLQDSIGRLDENSGYARLVDNQQLGQLLSRVHTTVIRMGNELGRILAARTPLTQINLEQLLAIPRASYAQVEVISNGKLRIPNRRNAVEIDLMVVDHINRGCQVIEVKDGDTFDTKKADGELEHLTLFAREISRLLGYTVSYHFCSFHQPDKNRIVTGIKNRFSLDQVMTGVELCELLQVEYEDVLEYRRREHQENLPFFLDEMIRIPEVRAGLVQRLGHEDLR